MGFTVYDYREDVRNVLVTPQIRSRFMRMEPGEDGGAHSHDLGQEVFLVLEGCAEFTIDGESKVVGPGQMCVALVDQLHSLRVVGDEPMTMYLSVTPHIQPTHTMWSADGNRMPHRFIPSSAYDIEPDTSTPLPELMQRLTEATRAVSDAAGGALVREESTTIREGDAAAPEARVEIWDGLVEVFRRSAELAELWNEIAPRAEGT
jgi:quercetin dioxygenase-like cupin family protein